MNIINLRNVGSLEIPDSYRGILRISPNDGVDDPSEKLLNLETIELSDSDGNLLPLKFIPKEFSTIVIGRDSNSIDMIHIMHEYNKLFVSKSLNVRSHVYINTTGAKAPLLFSDGINSVGYPLDSPCDASYFNNNNTYNFSPDNSYETNLEKIKPDDKLYTDDKHQWIKINGEILHDYIKQADGNYIKLPIIKRRDYTLGHTIGQRYKKEKAIDTIHDLSDDEITTNTHTQLSFIPLESLIYSTIESLCSGLYRAPINGRYYGLYPTFNNNEIYDQYTQDKLGETLFGNRDENEETVSKVAPILGIPVQSGTIHYNAIPAHNYFFHLLRHYNEKDGRNHLEDNSGTIKFAPEIPTNMAALTKQYVLCDGKNIKDDYPNIDKEVFKNNYGSIHKAIAKSMQSEGSNDESFNTPRLFEFDQLSLRFIRGLNWIRYYTKKDDNDNDKEISMVYDAYKNDNGSIEDCPIINRYENIKIEGKTYPIHFQDNTYPYKKLDESVDAANNIKDIHEVGMYYSNTDIALQTERKHFHLSFATPQDEVNIYKTDDLYKEHDIFVGSSENELPKNSTEWKKYVNASDDNISTKVSFLGTKILKTAGSILYNSSSINKDRLRKLQNYPISAKGGGITPMHEVAQCVRYGKHIFILVGVKCMNHRTSCQEFNLRDSYYHLASHNISKPASSTDNNDSTTENDNDAETSLSGSKWRLISSLPRGNKYGKINGFNADFSEAKFIKASSNTKSSKNQVRENNILSIKIDDSLCSPTSNNFIPLMKI